MNEEFLQELSSLDCAISGLTCAMEHVTIDGERFREQRNLLLNKKLNLIAENYAKNIWQGKSGVWRAYLPDETKPKGRRLIESKTKEGLLKKIASAFDASSEKNVLFHDFFTDWLLNVKALTVKPNSLDHIAYTYRTYVEGTKLDGMRVSAITRSDIRGFCEDVAARKVPREVFMRIRTLISQVFRYALSVELISENPAADIPVPLSVPPAKKSVSLSKNEVLDDGELEAFVQVLRSRFKLNQSFLYLCLLLNCELGLRIGELVALRVSDIDFVNGLIHIQRTMRSYVPVAHSGDNLVRKGHVLTVSEDGDMKTDSSVRTLLLTDNAVEIIQTALDVHKKKGYKGDWLFPSRFGNPLCRQSVSLMFRQCCELAGIPPRSTHKLRKTVISRLFNNGFDTSMIKEWAGHSSLQTTMSYYVFSTETQKKMREKLNKTLSLVPTQSSEKPADETVKEPNKTLSLNPTQSPA